MGPQRVKKPTLPSTLVYLLSHLLRKLRLEDHLSPGVQEHPGSTEVQNNKTKQKSGLGEMVQRVKREHLRLDSQYPCKSSVGPSVPANPMLGGRDRCIPGVPKSVQGTHTL